MNMGVAQNRMTTAHELPSVHSADDQRKAFRRARRHSFMIKGLKRLMPVLSIVILGLYFVPYGTVQKLSELPVSVGKLDLGSDGLKMINPRYSGSNPKLGTYRIEAEYALQQVKTPHILKMHNISGDIEHPDRKWTKMTAKQGTYDTKTEKMTLSGAIHIISNRGMEVRLQSADMNVKQQQIISRQPVMMRLHENTINAGNMNLGLKNKRLFFSGGVKMRLYKLEKLSEQSTTAATPPQQ
jgi:lipopolysaccharide export system protein LptC